MAVSITFTTTGGITGPSSGSISGFGSVYNAVWNDITDCISVPEGTPLEYGCVYCFDGENYHKSEKYLDDGIMGIHSDTYGFALGKESDEDNGKLQIAIGGFVLAHVDQEYPVGTPLTATCCGYLTKISDKDKAMCPDKIVATYWRNEDRKEFGLENRMIQVNGRKWVKVK